MVLGTSFTSTVPVLYQQVRNRLAALPEAEIQHKFSLVLRYVSRIRNITSFIVVLWHTISTNQSFQNPNTNQSVTRVVTNLVLLEF